MNQPETRTLRTGFSTGACATAACAAAYRALVSGIWSNPVNIVLPRGQEVEFALEDTNAGPGWASASVRKDAGDDPDVTHNALIVAKVRASASPISGVIFRAGVGVGIVTKAGLPVSVGEPAINPVPRQMMQKELHRIGSEFGVSPNVEVEISVPGGKELASKTWNPRLGIVGGISILGTTGIVRPYSCSAWIASIHSGIDVARANGCSHVAGSTGSVSEASVAKLYRMPDWAMLDMGDFVGGMIKYLRTHPVQMLTVAGGFAKLSKLAQGAIDLHSRRSQVDFQALSQSARRVCPELGPDDVSRIKHANTAMEVLEICGPELAQEIAQKARGTVKTHLRKQEIEVETLVFDRSGKLVGSASSAKFMEKRNPL